MAAAAIRDELISRSVRVRSVGRGQADSLRLPDIAAQLLDRPRETLTEDDLVGLFEVMAAREAAESRSVLIIDDAEVLQPSALEYLRLMAILAMDAPPQFVFVGRPEFWEVTNRTAPSQFKDLITARWELGRLSADTTRAFIERLVASQEQSIGDVFDAGGLAALMQKSDGLFGRIVALLTRARAIQAAQCLPRVTSGVIEAAALDDGETTALDYGRASANSAAVHTAAAESEPVPDAALALPSAPPELPDPAGEPFGAVGTVAYWGIPTWPFDRLPPGSPNRPLSLRRRGYAYALSLVLVLSAAGTVYYWGIPAGADRTSTPATELDAPASVASPDQSAASGAAAPSQQRTMPAHADIETTVANQSPLSLFQDAPPAAAQPESGQPTASVANRSGATVPQADVSIADNAPEQSAPHVTTPDTTVAAVAMPAAPLQAAPTQGQLAGASAETPDEPPSPQAAMPPAAPLPAVSTPGSVAAASAATPTEPPSPQAAMPPAASLPTVPTPGPVAAASAATPTEPQAPRAAMPPAAPLPTVPTPGPVAAASAATPTERQAPQAAIPPAAPLPTVPTPEPVAAASAATPTEPQAPRAAMPPAAPLPTVPTPGPVAAASAVMLTEPQAPRVAMPPAAPLPTVPTPGPVAAASAAAPVEPQAPQAAAPLPAAPAPGAVAAATTPDAPRAPQTAMPSAAPAQQQATAEQAMAELYAARGDDMLEIRDLSAARRFYETAANAGSGRAAMALGRTYDPAFLSQMQVIGLRPDPALAATWYRRAADLGVPEAAAELRALTTNAAR